MNTAFNIAVTIVFINSVATFYYLWDPYFKDVCKLPDNYTDMSRFRQHLARRKAHSAKALIFLIIMACYAGLATWIYDFLISVI